jgi:predicted  nucleic acid-binding Zn-ribbon protein
MADKDLIRQYKDTIVELTKEKEENFKTIKDKDLRIKKILIELEQANDDIQSMGRKINDLETKLNKKQDLSKKIDKVLSEQSEKKVSNSVDMDEKI